MGHKRIEQVRPRIGCLKARHPRVTAPYRTNLTADEIGRKAVAAP